MTHQTIWHVNSPWDLNRSRPLFMAAVAAWENNVLIRSSPISKHEVSYIANLPVVPILTLLSPKLRTTSLVICAKIRAGSIERR